MSTFPAWLEGARAAPSRYNTQPWRFDPQHNGDIVVKWDPRRALPASDPTGRDLFLSLGAAVESACLRAGAAGKPLAFQPAPDADVHTVGRLTATTEGDDPSGKRLAPYLDERRTARTRHLQFPLPPIVQLTLRRETVGWGSLLHITTDRADIQRLAALVRQGMMRQYDQPEARAEMSAWYRLTAVDEAAHRDGVSAECLQLRGVMLATARWALAGGSRYGPPNWCASRVLVLREWTVARHTAAFCLLTAQSTDRSDMVRAGRLLIRLWLLAAEAGLSAHAVSPVLQTSGLTQRCLDVFKAPGAVPACVFRLGFCPPVAASPRLQPEQLLREAGTAPLTSTREVRG